MSLRSIPSLETFGCWLCCVFVWCFALPTQAPVRKIWITARVLHRFAMMNTCTNTARVKNRMWTWHIKAPYKQYRTVCSDKISLRVWLWESLSPLAHWRMSPSVNVCLWCPRAHRKELLRLPTTKLKNRKSVPFPKQNFQAYPEYPCHSVPSAERKCKRCNDMQRLYQCTGKTCTDPAACFVRLLVSMSLAPTTQHLYWVLFGASGTAFGKGSFEVYKRLPDSCLISRTFTTVVIGQPTAGRRYWKDAEFRNAAWMLTSKNHHFLPSPRLERVAGDVFQCGTWRKQPNMWPPQDSIGFVHWFTLNVTNPETHFFQPGDGHTMERNLKSFGSGRLLPERKLQCTVPSTDGAGHKYLATLRASPRAARLVLRQSAVAQQQIPSWCSSGFLCRPLLATGCEHGVVY